MPERLRSLRFKLTVTFVLAFGLLQAAVWVGVDLIRTRYMYGTFDERLVEHAQTTIEVADTALRGTAALDAAVMKQALRPIERPEFYVQIKGADDGNLYRSPTLSEVELPFPPLVDKGYELLPYFQTIRQRNSLSADTFRLRKFGDRRPHDVVHRAPDTPTHRRPRSARPTA
jgi:hypothetical protein